MVGCFAACKYCAFRYNWQSLRLSPMECRLTKMYYQQSIGCHFCASSLLKQPTRRLSPALRCLRLFACIHTSPYRWIQTHLFWLTPDQAGYLLILQTLGRCGSPTQRMRHNYRLCNVLECATRGDGEEGYLFTSRSFDVSWLPLVANLLLLVSICFQGTLAFK